MTAPDTPSGQNQLMEDAAMWFARMRGPDAEASRAAFEAWLARGALHRSAYNRAAEIFAMGKLLDEEDMARPERARRRLPLAALLVAGLAAALVATVLMIRQPASRSPESAEIARTDMTAKAPGARLASPADAGRAVRLADGSLVMLAPASEVALVFDAAERRLVLIGGRARFAVAHEVRPFIVHAGGGRIVARGTLFEVALTGGRRVAVRLIEGAIDVEQPAALGRPQPATRRLGPGEALTYQVAVAPPPVPPAAPSPPATGTPSAARDHEAVPVAALLAEANRTARRPIRLADPATGARRVSGRFRLDDGDRLAERLAGLFDLVVDRRDPREIVLRPR